MLIQFTDAISGNKKGINLAHVVSFTHRDVVEIYELKDVTEIATVNGKIYVKESYDTVAQRGNLKYR